MLQGHFFFATYLMYTKALKGNVCVPLYAFTPTMKLIIDLEENMRQFIWPQVGKYLEKFQASQSKSSHLSISYNPLEYESISSSESLVTCSESFRNIGDNMFIGEGDNLNTEFKTCSSNELIVVGDELVSIISTTNDTNSYKDINFSCISSLEFPSSEIGPLKHSSKEELEPSAPLFNDEIARLIEDMILVLEDPGRSVDNLPEIKELERDLDYQEVTKALSIP